MPRYYSTTLIFQKGNSIMFRLHSKAYVLFALIVALLLTGVTKSNAQAPTIVQPYQFYLIPFYYSGTSIEGASTHPMSWTNNTGSTQNITVSYGIGLADDGTVTVNGDEVTLTSNEESGVVASLGSIEATVLNGQMWQPSPTRTLFKASHYHAAASYYAAAFTKYQVNDNPATTTTTSKWWIIEKQF